ncbi:MAG TPA: ion transporter [Patescibacteria group bacterium]|nr:ion transporter [Patescibacteria group bacterium]
METTQQKPTLWRTIIHDINRDKRCHNNKEGRHISVFHRITAFAVLAYAVILGLESFKNPEINGILHALDIAITFFFGIELVLRIMAESHHLDNSEGHPPVRHTTLDFFKQRIWEINGKKELVLKRKFTHDNFWNIFDFTIITASIIAVTFHFTAHPELIFAARLLRISRILLLFDSFEGIRVTLDKVIKVLPTVLHFGFLLFTLLYCYGILGTFLFADRPEYFGNIFTALMTLFKTLTLDGWTETMGELSMGYEFAPLYFVSFVVMTALVFLNVFIGVLSDSVNNEFTDKQEVLVDKQDKILAKQKAIHEEEERIRRILRQEMVCIVEMRNDLKSLHEEIRRERLELRTDKESTPIETVLIRE